jgi:Leucine-rich repeat (LRR) protein
VTNDKLLKIIQAAKLGRRTSLTLGDNKIKELPAEIGELASLMDLDMSRNELETHPS